MITRFERGLSLFTGKEIFAVVFCLAATVYAFVEKGALWGVLGLVLTVLVYLFASKAR